MTKWKWVYHKKIVREIVGDFHLLTIIMNTLSCFDQDSKLEHFLSDTDKRFRNIVIEGDILKIHVDGTWSSTDRIALQTDIEDNFPELREVSIIIVDKYDRLQESDKRRRDLEQQVQNEVRVLVEKSEIGANDIDHVKLRFTLLSRLLR